METGYWHQLRQGEEEAFMKMYDHYYQVLFTFGCRVNPDKEMVKDCIHELFCELWEKRFTLPEVSQEKSYLFTYLKRKIVRTWQAAQKAANLQIAGLPDIEYSYESMLIQSQSDEESRIRVQNLLRRISPAQLQIIEYKFFEMMSYEEIAIRMDLSPRTVYNQVYEALKTMRSHLRFTMEMLLILLSSF